jgi:L-2-hydroxyglutarate oxidase LhgO
LKSKNTNDVFKTHIYPVPDINQPFLGVHTTLTSDNYLKLGPTAIPAFSPENYKFFENLDIKLTPEILLLQSSLFLNNNFRFRDLALREFRYLFKENIVKSAQEITNYNLKDIEFDWYSPGIRAQLYNLKKQNLENDLIIEFKDSTIHILNSISPAWTCAFKTAQFILNYLNEFLI